MPYGIDGIQLSINYRHPAVSIVVAITARARKLPRWCSECGLARLRQPLTDENPQPQVNETLQHLDIAGNGIGVDLFLLLCDGLLLNHSLTYLDVSSNALGPDAGAALGQLLANSTAGLSPSADRQTADESGTADERGGNGSRRTPMPPLATCVCGANGLGDQGAAGFAAQIADNACLMRLDLSANDFSDSGFRQLGPALANNLHALTHLSLASNRLSLHSLSPFFSEVHTSEAFEARPPECRLDRLALVLGFHHSMPRSSLLNSGAPAGLELLARLDLSCTGIGDLGALACMAGLSGHRCLEEIVLSSSLLTDIGAAAVGACIYSCPRMRVLCLSQNHVTSIGLIALFRWLLAQGCRGFRAPHCRLILRGNRIGSPPAGTQMRSDEEMLATIEHILKTHVALTELDLRGNPIAEAAEQVMRQVAAERDKYRCKFRFAPGSATMAGVSSSGEDEWIEAGDEEEVEQFETELRQLHIKLVDMGFARSHVDHVLTRHFNFHDAFRQLKALD